MHREMRFGCAALALVGCWVANADSLSQIGNVRLKGPMGDRLNQMIERHVVATDADYLVAPFKEKTERKGWWQTEFWGKWMHAAAPYLKYAPSDRLRASVESGIDQILASQEPNGYIGNYPDELRCGEGWDVWGMKYTMMGLLHYYDWTRGRAPAEVEKGDRALAACGRLCDYVIGEIGPNGKRGRALWQTGNWSGFASSSILEPVVWLYNRTSEKRFLDFATYVVRGMTEPDEGPRLLDLALRDISVADRNGYGNKAETHGGYVMKHNRWKAYEMMSCYQGLVEYWEVMKDSPLVFRGEKASRLLEAAVRTGEQIVRDEINLAGGCACSEAWFHGSKKQHLPYLHLQETCVTTTWMRFCEKLLDLTDDPKWADELERSFYNIYLAALKPDGTDFSAYIPLSGNRYHGHHHCDMHQNCCNANGPRGFICFLKEAFRTAGDAATFNFYASSLVKGVIPQTGKKVAFDVYTTYPRGGEVRIVSHTEGAGTVPLRLRIPAWSAKTEIRLNGGTPCKDVKPGSYYTLAHDWKMGDRLVIRFDMAFVAHTIADRGVTVPGAFDGKDAKATARPHYIAFTYGPILLARDSRFADGDLNECFNRAFADGQRMTTFEPVRSPSDAVWMAFSAKLPIGSHTENPEGRLGATVFFCDYASAGNTWNRADFYRTWFPIQWGPTE